MSIRRPHQRMTLRRAIASTRYVSAVALILCISGCGSEVTADQASVDASEDVDERSSRQVTQTSVAGFSMRIAAVFTISGKGIVITGKVEEGSVAVGDTVCIAELGPHEVLAIEQSRKEIVAVGAGEMAGLLFDGPDKKEVTVGSAVHACS